jgi:hypothetical protein
MIVLCNLRVEIKGSKGLAHTYCMRPLGHDGECNPEPQPGDKNLPLTKNS